MNYNRVINQEKLPYSSSGRGDPSSLPPPAPSWMETGRIPTEMELQRWSNAAPQPLETLRGSRYAI